MSFLESPRFPDEVAAWAIGGPRFNVTKVQTYGGNEYRNAPWQYPLGRWSGFGNAMREASVTATYSFIVLRDFLLASGGELSGFRLKVFADYQDDAHGVLGTTGLAVASTTAYQMFKNYVQGGNSYQRLISKPVASTIKVYKNAVLQTLTTDYTLSSTTGVITFTSQPTVGQTIKWTGDFDTPVRFDGDEPAIGLDNSGALYVWENLVLTELRNP